MADNSAGWADPRATVAERFAMFASDIGLTENEPAYDLLRQGFYCGIVACYVAMETARKRLPEHEAASQVAAFFNEAGGVTPTDKPITTKAIH